MENKLQQLTHKLYEEGLEKGRSEAEKCVAEAQEKAEIGRASCRERV